MPQIVSLVYQPEATDLTPPPRYKRVPIETVELVAKHGIKGDRKAGRNPKRNLNLMARETLDALAAQGFKTAAGEMGEQIQVQGIDFASLPVGTRLQLGESAIIELNKPRTGCVWLEAIQGQGLAGGDYSLGVLATVIQGGVVNLGDEIKVLEVAHTQP